jgi:GR25 family glycosyltransferase involved in LPS biosynthesis
LPKKSSNSFGSSNGQPRIEHIYVINLNRHSSRWDEMEKELRHVRDCSGGALWNLTERHVAVDATHLDQEPVKDSQIDPTYTLQDQLYVEPQPLTITTRMELDSCIHMSRQEIAVARSHIEVWRRVAQGADEYALILEDDVWFRSCFTKSLDLAWNEIMCEGNSRSSLDILYLSYEEVKNGAPKTFLSSEVFRPMRGLWHLSGYVLSRSGAMKLLRFLPCRGPIDLWINHQFQFLDVRALKKSVISQRRDVSSSNLYSILPALTKIGAITSEKASLFHLYPTARPVIAFGAPGSGLSSLAMGISMLGYRCCSDLQTLPTPELEMLLSGKNDRMFNAYVNIQILDANVRTLKVKYPDAKFIIACNTIGLKNDNDLSRILTDLEGADVAIFPLDSPNKWKIICEHLGCAPPVSPFPELSDLGQRQPLCRTEVDAVLRHEVPRRDKSPWIAKTRQGWQGIYLHSCQFLLR